MPKARELTEVEKFYIENNPQKSSSSIAAKMDGVGASTVNKYRESVGENQTQEDEKGTDEEKRFQKLASGPNTGNFISSSRGVTVMTQQASEVADAKKTVSQKADRKKESTHRPKG